MVGDRESDRALRWDIVETDAASSVMSHVSMGSCTWGGVLEEEVRERSRRKVLLRPAVLRDTLDSATTDDSAPSDSEADAAERDLRDKVRERVRRKEGRGEMIAEAESERGPAREGAEGGRLALSWEDEKERAREKARRTEDFFFLLDVSAVDDNTDGSERGAETDRGGRVAEEEESARPCKSGAREETVEAEMTEGATEDPAVVEAGDRARRILASVNDTEPSEGFFGRRHERLVEEDGLVTVMEEGALGMEGGCEVWGGREGPASSLRSASERESSAKRAAVRTRRMFFGRRSRWTKARGSSWPEWASWRRQVCVAWRARTT
mmetsp:Transcript_12834/g.20949  ORF Transcript_12834/g.20949 Transcript_12834/m.20949 type:complete len:324 (+) Transcript_12834:1993-2964(+)